MRIQPAWISKTSETLSPSKRIDSPRQSVSSSYLVSKYLLWTKEPLSSFLYCLNLNRFPNSLLLSYSLGTICENKRVCSWLGLCAVSRNINLLGSILISSRLLRIKMHWFGVTSRIASSATKQSRASPKGISVIMVVCQFDSDQHSRCSFVLLS